MQMARYASRWPNSVNIIVYPEALYVHTQMALKACGQIKKPQL